jgi:hypothetical protein
MKKLSVLALLGVMVLTLALGVASVSAQATTKSLSTNYTVQNLGTDIANIEVDYRKDFDVGGGAWTADPANTTFTVPVGGSKVVAQYLDTVMSDGRGSATIASDQPVAAIVNMLARGQTPTSGAYTAFEAGSPSFYMPFAFKNLVTSVGTINSQLIIMNVGTAPTDVSVAMIHGVTGVTDYTKNITALEGGESYYYDQALETNLDDGWYGSAYVSAAAGGFVAVVGNQFTGAHGLLTYPGFEGGYTEWSIPLYVSRLSNGYNSVIAIQNVSGGTIATGGIDVVFTPDPGLTGATPFTITLASDLENNSTWTVNPRANPAFPTDSYGAARIVATADVVAIVNQLVNEPPNLGTSALSFNAIRADLTGTTVVAPLIMSRLPNRYSTVFTVANLTDTAGTCDFNYKGDAGYGSSDVSVDDVPLPASGSIVHNHRLPGTHGLPEDWYGAATVSCTQPAAGMVNSLQTLSTGDPDTSYNAFTR